MSDLIKQQSNPPFLLGLISKKQIDARQLTTHQRRICVRFLLQEMKHTQVEIATIMGVCNAVITRDKQLIIKQNSWYLDDIDEKKFAIDIIQSAEVSSARLYRQGKNKEAFDVKVKCLEILQTLGYVTKKPLEVAGHLTFQEVLRLAAEIKPDPQSINIGSNRIC